MSQSVFTAAKKGIKAKAFDAEGNEVQFDVREDSEQGVKLQETVDLLLAAGYFRARIKGLSPFDKVVGGMTWCITASNEEVDVDLLFQENSTIGQKIALTEKIVAALPRMKCPHRLEPYQIQGLDFINIFPVVQWLVKKAFETREEMTQQIRDRALFVFDSFATSPEQIALEATREDATASVQTVQSSYKPRRQYRASQAPQGGEDEETRVHRTLLEYGRRYGIGRRPDGDKDKKKKASALKGLPGTGAGDEKEEDLAEIEERRVQALMSGLSQAEAGEGAVSQSAIGSIINAQSAAIAQLSEAYAREQALLAGGDEGRVGGAAAHQRAVEVLRKQIEQSGKRLDAIKARHEEMSQAYQEAQAGHDKAAKYSQRLDTEFKKLDELEGDEANQVILAKLRGLITLNEQLKDQESKFKASCLQEMTSLQERIDRLKGEGVEHIDSERAQAIGQQYEEDLQKLQKIKVLSAKRNREIAAIQRKIDEIPSRQELTQYQRRFVELYEQMSSKHRETKQYFTLYNTLDDTKLYMTKEVNLLNSIHDNFTKAMSSASTKEQFLQQFSSIVQGIRTNKEKVEDRQTKEKMQRDKLSDVYLDLVEKERVYYKTVKEYESECNKNELLLQKLKKRKA